MYSLSDCEVEGNPLAAGEEEALLKIIHDREFGRLGNPYVDADNFLRKDGLERAALLGDHLFYRYILSNAERRAKITNKFFLFSSTVKVRKMVLAIKNKDDMAEHIIMSYRQAKKINLGSMNPQVVKVTLDMFDEARKRLKPMFEYLLADGEVFPHSTQDLEVLKKNLEKCMAAKPSLNPMTIKQWVEEWQEGIRKSGIPPSLKTGYLGV